MAKMPVKTDQNVEGKRHKLELFWNIVLTLRNGNKLKRSAFSSQQQKRQKCGEKLIFSRPNNCLSAWIYFRQSLWILGRIPCELNKTI